MTFSRRTFLHRGTLATVALAAGSGLSSALPGLADTPELANLRQLVSGYARQVTVRCDSSRELIMVCEIADLGKFTEAMAKLIPSGAQVQPDGNTLSFEQNGRQIQLENVWKS